MFDIGFWELGLIGVVALLVIGPERLPGVARTAGMWIGRARRFVGSVQADINQEIGKADELKQLLEEQARIKSTHEIIEQTANEVREGLSVPAINPDDMLRSVDSDKSEPAQQMTHSVAASSSSTKATPTSNEPLKADDAKHDQSA